MKNNFNSILVQKFCEICISLIHDMTSKFKHIFITEYVGNEKDAIILFFPYLNVSLFIKIEFGI